MQSTPPRKGANALASRTGKGTLAPARLLVAWLPLFRLERCGWSPYEHVALVHPERGALRILATSLHAAREGVRVGMSATQARALLPELNIEHLDSPEAEEDDLRDLAAQFSVLAPHPGFLAPDTLFVNISKTAHLMGGETACVEMALRRLRSLGHLSRVWVVDADRVGAVQAARALARWKKKHQVLAPGSMAEALSGLPMDFLPLSDALHDSLYALGIRTAGALAALPAASVAHRYGAEGLWLQKLARAHKRPPEAKPRWTAQSRPQFEHHFVLPATHTVQLMAVLKQGLEHICAALVQREQATLQLHLQLHLENARDLHLHLHLGRAQRDARALSALLHQRLESVRLDAGVAHCVLEAQELCPYTGQQRSLLDRSQAAEDFETLTARLSDSLGSQALFQPQLTDTHRPEEAWTHSPKPPKEILMPALCRPTLLLPAPRPLDVHQQANWPTKLEIEGRWISVRGAQGPERLCGEWWRPGAFDRDYWRLQLMDGRCPWIFCDRTTGRWWLHGWFE